MPKYSSALKNKVKPLSIPSRHHPISFLSGQSDLLKILFLFLYYLCRHTFTSIWLPFPLFHWKDSDQTSAILPFAKFIDFMQISWITLCSTWHRSSPALPFTTPSFQGYPPPSVPFWSPLQVHFSLSIFRVGVPHSFILGSLSTTPTHTNFFPLCCLIHFHALSNHVINVHKSVTS